MTTRFAYDRRLDPPAPVIPARVVGRVNEDAVMLPMLVDTGADGTLVPARIVRRLGLPPVDGVAVSGVDGLKQRATVHLASVELGELRVKARIIAFADEAILGRDVLNQGIVTLDGPSLAISLQPAAHRRRRSRTAR
jgi:predicted aspartyl protease